MSTDAEILKTIRADKLISENSELKKMIDENQNYYNQIKKYSFEELINNLQPRWSNQNFLNEKETMELTLLFFEYRVRGLDPEYFTAGAGSHVKRSQSESCIIL